jgi:hypothetical protein
MSQAKHTPLPWNDPAERVDGKYNLSAEDGDRDGAWIGTIHEAADAAFVVHACNAHYRMEGMLIGVGTRLRLIASELPSDHPLIKTLRELAVECAEAALPPAPPQIRST